MTSVFEAIVNAVTHRDYSMHQSKIRLQMFSDRVELYSPGGLPNTLELDMLSYRQARPIPGSVRCTGFSTNLK